MLIKYKDVTLRAIEEEDLGLLREMINDPEIEKMTGGGGLPVSRKDQKEWYEHLNKRDIRLIIDTEVLSAIGTVMLTDIDYCNSSAQCHIKLITNAQVRNKGYGTKAIYALVQHAFLYLNLHCIYSQILDYNIASQKAFAKCGFKQEGILRSRVYKNGKYHDVTMWSVLKDEFSVINDCPKKEAMD